MVFILLPAKKIWTLNLARHCRSPCVSEEPSVFPSHHREQDPDGPPGHRVPGIIERSTQGGSRPSGGGVEENPLKSCLSVSRVETGTPGGGWMCLSERGVLRGGFRHFPGGWIFGSRSRSGISSKKKWLERELEDERSAGSGRASDRGDLDTGDKRQKVAELFSKETANNIESKVIDTWYRNNKGKKSMDGE